MTFAERNKPDTTPSSPALGLDPKAKSRLSRALPFEDRHDDSHALVMESANSVVPELLSRLDPLLCVKQSGGAITETITYRQSGHLMDAVNILNVSGNLVNYGPKQNGERLISTENHSLLQSVNRVLADSAEKVGKEIGSLELDPQTRSWITSTVMDEAISSVHSEFRRRKEDIRRQEEKVNRGEREAKSTPQAEKNGAAKKTQEVVLLDNSRELVRI